MRTNVRSRAPLGKRALFSFIGKVAGVKIPDVAYVMVHRPELFGRDFSRWLHSLLRGSSVWSIGERELMASYTSRLQECEF